MSRFQSLEYKNRAGSDDDDDDEDDSPAQKVLRKAVDDRIEAKVADLLKPFSESVTNIEKKMNRPSLLGGFPSGGASADSAEVAAIESKALKTFLRSKNHMEFELVSAVPNEDERKAMSVGSDPDGGFTVFPVLSTRINKRIFDQGGMRRVADIQTLTEGDAWEEPIDFDDVGATWVNENEERPETSTAQVGVLRIPLHEIYAMPKISQKMIDTSSWDVGAWLEGKLSDKFGRSEGAAFITGNGVGKPRGLLSYEVGSKTTPNPLKIPRTVSGSATGLTPDGLIKVVWDLPAAYRFGARWLMNSASAASIQLFKDANDRYLWLDGIAGAMPTLLGYPVEIDENMPNAGAGSEPVAFGNWKYAYTIIERPGYKMLKDPYSDKPHVLFYTYKRVGGGLRNGQAAIIQRVSV
ncbi:phage major capsid protein [Rhizobium ruizarguesonis]|uniref:phage major capsid protein n=1 Tax=Rhizobium ruizarguesonis TaxID=2081791 RepID=UPI0013EEEF4D|nr:phage major capsid protein [Rhizobium ruizarguesonis]